MSLRLREGVFAGVLSMPKVSLLDVRRWFNVSLFSGRISVSESSEAGTGEPRVLERLFAETTAGELGVEDGGEKVCEVRRVRVTRSVAGGVVTVAIFNGLEPKRGLGVVFECCAATLVERRGE
jgi:hypothetical protein